MPVALSTTLVEQAKALFYQGVNFVDISKQLHINPGTLRGWSTKQNWKRRKEEARLTLEQAGKQTMALEVAKDLTAESNQLRAELSNELREQSQALRNKPITSAKQVAGKDGRAATSLTIARTAAMVYGWDQSSGNSIINIGTINQVRENPDMITEVNHTQVVDVDTVETETPSN